MIDKAVVYAGKCTIDWNGGNILAVVSLNLDSPHLGFKKWDPWIDINKVLCMASLLIVQQAGEVCNLSRTICNGLH